MRLTEGQIRRLVRGMLTESGEPLPTLNVDRFIPALVSLIQRAEGEAQRILRGDLDEMNRRLSEEAGERYEIENALFDELFYSMWEKLNESPPKEVLAAEKLLNSLRGQIDRRLSVLSVGENNDEGDHKIAHYLNEYIVQSIIPPMPESIGWRSYRENSDPATESIIMDLLQALVAETLDRELILFPSWVARPPALRKVSGGYRGVDDYLNALAQRCNSIKITQDGVPLVISALKEHALTREGSVAQEIIDRMLQGNGSGAEGT